jgi:CubicO group peptidase (beta-lactamase class C family)
MARGLERAIASTYLGRYLLFNRPTNYDDRRLPQRVLAPSPAPVALPRASVPAALAGLLVAPRPGTMPVQLPRLLDDTGTTAFVVLVDGRIVWEHYANGGGADLAERCFSVTKSIASALVGLAVQCGAIASLEAPIGTWLPELRDPGVRRLTLAHLLEMRSGIHFVEGVLPWLDEPRTYYATDLRRRLLTRAMTDPPGAFFHYNDWHPLLLSLILERATGVSVTEWLQTRLWDPLGATGRASMMVDRTPNGLEHLESGLTAIAYDLAKFGQLYLQDGVWDGTRLLPEGWVRSSTSPDGARTDAEWWRYYRERPWGRFLASGRVYYKRLWWGTCSTAVVTTTSRWACSGSTSTCRQTPVPSWCGCRIDFRLASGGRRCSGGLSTPRDEPPARPSAAARSRTTASRTSPAARASPPRGPAAARARRPP